MKISNLNKTESELSRKLESGIVSAIINTTGNNGFEGKEVRTKTKDAIKLIVAKKYSEMIGLGEKWVSQNLGKEQ